MTTRNDDDGLTMAVRRGTGTVGPATAGGNGLQDVLVDLGSRVPARLVILIDASGYGLGRWGDSNGLDLTSLSALAAGDLAASREIARIMGEYEAHQIVLREGRSSYILVTDAGPQMVLLALVDSHVPMGWARMLVGESVLRLASMGLERSDVQVELRPPVKIEGLFEALDRALDGGSVREDEC